MKRRWIVAEANQTVADRVLASGHRALVTWLRYPDEMSETGPHFRCWTFRGAERLGIRLNRSGRSLFEVFGPLGNEEQ